MDPSKLSDRSISKFLIPLLISGSVAYIVYTTYKKINLQQNKRVKKDNKHVQNPPSMLGIQPQTGFQQAVAQSQSQSRSKSSLKSLKSSTQSLISSPSSTSITSANKSIYIKETTPAIPRFQRRPSIPKFTARKHFLGESSYRETVIFLLAFACFRLFPNEELVVENTFKFGIRRRSYLCRFIDSDNKNSIKFQLNSSKVKLIRNEIQKLCKMELELHSKFVDYDKCLEMLTITHQSFSSKLIASLNRPCYRMVGVDLPNGNSFYILQYRSTLNNSKYCNKFRLRLSSNTTKNKFVLLFPHHDDLMDDDGIDQSFSAINDDDDDASMNDAKDENEFNQPKAINELYAHGLKMSKMLNCNCVADINKTIQSGRFKELMLIAEAYHNRQIVKIATDIHKRQSTLKIILISGPSSSGKTTFASKLGLQLRLLGFIPTVLEVDMFFKDRKDPTHPRDSSGNLNFEVIDALKIEEFNRTISALVSGKKIRVPIFDFTIGARTGYQSNSLQLDPHSGVLIMEGIFCLNPALFNINIDNLSYKIFICPISPFYSLDNYHFISEQVMRLVRRISRDHFHRGNNANQTVFKWGQLKAGEDINIFPFVKYADSVFNSALIYELSVLKVYSYPLLQTVNGKSEQYKDAQNLLAFLDCFLTMPDSSVPHDSLLMEFIGKSIFEEI